ncbi:hypothetical protein ABT237_11540 [Streptomyces sp. NPDC001581]|uniref:hypothetical protein n=1 Tax=Streptomyces sp. NPDC001581 TaxID=3154386 RepID=UPI00331D7E03
MNAITENVAAGLLLAALLWTFRLIRDAWRRHTSATDQTDTLEQPMPRPGAIAKPTLPPGPHRQLNDLLHDLHARAGRPSLRDLADATKLGRTSISDAFSKPKLCTKHTATQLGARLALLVTDWGTDLPQSTFLDQTGQKISNLWDRADAEAKSPEPDTVEQAVRTVWEHYADGQSGRREVTYEVRAAMEKATIISAYFEGGENRYLSVSVTAPDEDTYFVLDGQYDRPFDEDWREMFGIDVGRAIDMHVDVSVYVLEDF